MFLDGKTGSSLRFVLSYCTTVCLPLPLLLLPSFLLGFILSITIFTPQITGLLSFSFRQTIANCFFPVSFFRIYSIHALGLPWIFFLSLLLFVAQLQRFPQIYFVLFIIYFTLFDVFSHLRPSCFLFFSQPWRSKVQFVDRNDFRLHHFSPSSLFFPVSTSESVLFHSSALFISRSSDSCSM